MSLSPRKKSDHHSSANQFQEKLHSWLKEQGLVSELKSHLRMQMVSALQDGSPSINRQFSISPKIQALTVLIADFFLQQGYSFSLSVLTTEVPFIGQMFSHLSQSSIKEALESGRLLSERFSARDVEDILETLGVPPGSKMHSEILSLYNDSSNNDSLLICIIRSLSLRNSETSRMNLKNVITNSEHVEERKEGLDSPDEIRNCCEHHTAESHELWAQEMYRSLAHNNITLCQIDELQNRMKKIHEAEISRVREEEAAKYHSLLEDYHKRQEEREQFFSEWQEKMRQEIDEKEEKLRIFANELISQHNDVKEKLAKLEAETEMMKQQENSLKEKMHRSTKELETKKSEMELEKKDIEKAYERLLLLRNKELELEEQRAEKERNEETKKFEEDANKKDAPTQLEGLNLLKWLQNQCNGLLLGGAHAHSHVEREDKGQQTVLPFLDIQNNVDAERKDDEKAELKERLVRQRRRIDELTTRAADLANQLQDAHATAQVMSVPVNASPINASATVRLHPRPAWPPHAGSGEETSFSDRPLNSISRSTQASRITENMPRVTATTALDNDLSADGAGNYSRRRTRRMPLRSAVTIAGTNNSSDESTSTEEMIEEARQRLRRLESESSEIHHTYQDFRLRLTQDIPPILSHPEQNRSHNPYNYRNFSPAGQSMISAGRNMLARTNPRTCTVKLDSVLNIRPTYDMFDHGYNQLQNAIVGKGSRHLSTSRLRSDDGISTTKDYLENVYRQSALQTFARPNISRPNSELNSLRKKVTERRFSSSLNPEVVGSDLEKSDNDASIGTTEEEKERSRLESDEVINESLRNHEMLCSEIDEKLLKRKEYLKKSLSDEDGNFRDTHKKRNKSLTFNETVTVVENDNETWCTARGGNSGEDDDSSDRTSVRGNDGLNAIPENQLVDDELQSESGNSNEFHLGSGIDGKDGGRKGLKSSSSSTLLGSRILDEDARIVNTSNVNSESLDRRGMISSALLLEQKCDISNNRDSIEDENNSSVVIENNGTTEEILNTRDFSDKNASLDVLGDSFVEEKERSRIRENSRGNSHPRRRSPSSLVSRVNLNNQGPNGPALPTIDSDSSPGDRNFNKTGKNFGSPQKLSPSEMKDRVPSFVLSPPRNGGNSKTNQDESILRDQVTSGEPDIVLKAGLIDGLEKTPITDSVGGGEVSVESSKVNGSNTASSVQNRNAVSPPRTNSVSAGDPWREPGDGIDYEKMDSDDPVSVGTQDSSSANSFW